MKNTQRSTQKKMVDVAEGQNEEEIEKYSKKMNEDSLVAQGQCIQNEDRLVAEGQYIQAEDRLVAEGKYIQAEDRLVAEGQCIQNEDRLVAEGQYIQAEDRLVAEGQCIQNEDRLVAEGQYIQAEDRLVAEGQCIQNEDRLVAEGQCIQNEDRLVAEGQYIQAIAFRLRKQNVTITFARRKLTTTTTLTRSLATKSNPDPEGEVIAQVPPTEGNIEHTFEEPRNENGPTRTRRSDTEKGKRNDESGGIDGEYTKEEFAGIDSDGRNHEHVGIVSDGRNEEVVGIDSDGRNKEVVGIDFDGRNEELVGIDSDGRNEELVGIDSNGRNEEPGAIDSDCTKDTFAIVSKCEEGVTNIQTLNRDKHRIKQYDEPTIGNIDDKCRNDARLNKGRIDVNIQRNAHSRQSRDSFEYKNVNGNTQEETFQESKNSGCETFKETGNSLVKQPKQDSDTNMTIHQQKNSNYMVKLTGNDESISEREAEGRNKEKHAKPTQRIQQDIEYEEQIRSPGIQKPTEQRNQNTRETIVSQRDEQRPNKIFTEDENGCRKRKLWIEELNLTRYMNHKENVVTTNDHNTHEKETNHEKQYYKETSNHDQYHETTLNHIDATKKRRVSIQEGGEWFTTRDEYRQRAQYPEQHCRQNRFIQNEVQEPRIFEQKNLEETNRQSDKRFTTRGHQHRAEQRFIQNEIQPPRTFEKNNSTKQNLPPYHPKYKTTNVPPYYSHYGSYTSYYPRIRQDMFDRSRTCDRNYSGEQTKRHYDRYYTSGHIKALQGVNYNGNYNTGQMKVLDGIQNRQTLRTYEGLRLDETPRKRRVSIDSCSSDDSTSEEKQRRREEKNLREEENLKRLWTLAYGERKEDSESTSKRPKLVGPPEAIGTNVIRNTVNVELTLTEKTGKIEDPSICSKETGETSVMNTNKQMYKPAINKENEETKKSGEREEKTNMSGNEVSNDDREQPQDSKLDKEMNMSVKIENIEQAAETVVLKTTMKKNENIKNNELIIKDDEKIKNRTKSPVEGKREQTNVIKTAPTCNEDDNRSLILDDDAYRPVRLDSVKGEIEGIAINNTENDQNNIAQPFLNKFNQNNTELSHANNFRNNRNELAIQGYVETKSNRTNIKESSVHTLHSNANETKYCVRQEITFVTIIETKEIVREPANQLNQMKTSRFVAEQTRVQVWQVARLGEVQVSSKNHCCTQCHNSYHQGITQDTVDNVTCANEEKMDYINCAVEENVENNYHHEMPAIENEQNKKNYDEMDNNNNMGKCEEKFCSRKGQEEKQTAKLDSLQMGTNKESENKRDVTTNMYTCSKIERRYHGVSQDKSNINDYTFNNAILESILKNRTFILPDMSSFGTKPETINLFIPNIVPLPRTIGKHLAIQSKTHERRRLCTQLRIKDGISRRSLNKVRVLVSKPKNRLVQSPRTDLFESVTIDKVKYKILRKIYVKSITKPQTKSVEQDKTICTIETKIKKVPLKPVIGLRNSKLNSNKSKRDQIISELNATKIERTARVKQIKCSLENINASRRKSSRNKHKKDQPTTKGLENVIETRKNFDRFSAENLKKTGKKRSSDENTDLETHSPRSDLFFSPRNDVFLSPRNGNFDEAYKTLFKHFTYQVSAEDIRQVTQSFRTENDEGEETNAKRDLPGLSKTHEQVKEKPKTHDNVIINSSPIMEYETLKHSENNVSPTFKMTNQDTMNKTVAEDMDQFTRSSNHAKVVEEDVNANTNIGRTRKESMRDNMFKSGDVAETRQFETDKTTHKAGTIQMSQSFRPSKLPVDDVKALSNARNNDTGEPKKLTKEHGEVIENRIGNETIQLKNTHVKRTRNNGCVSKNITKYDETTRFQNRHRIYKKTVDQIPLSFGKENGNLNQPNEDEAFDLRTRNNQNLKETRDLKESNDFQQQTGSATIRNSRFMNSVPIGKTYNGRMSSQRDGLSSERPETHQEKYNGTDVGSSSRIAQYSNTQTRRSVKKQGSLKYKNNNDNIPIEINQRIVPEDCTLEQGDSRSNEVKDDMFNARKDHNKQEEPSTFHQNNNPDYVDLNKAYTDFILAAYSARDRLNMIGRMNNETTSLTDTQYDACLGHPIVQFDTPSGTFQSHPDSFNTDSTTQWTNNVRAQTNKLVIINEKLQSGAYCNVQKPMCTMRPPLANNTHTKYVPIPRTTQLLTRTPVSKHAPPQKTQTYFFTPNLGDKIEKGPDNFENGQTSTCRPVLMSNECKCPLCIVQKNRPVPASQNPRIYNRLSSVPQNFIQNKRPPPQSHRYQPNILYQKNRMANENTPQMNRVLSIRPIQTLTNTRPNPVVSNRPVQTLTNTRPNLVVSNEPIEELYILRQNRCHGQTHNQPVLLKEPQPLQSLDLRQQNRRHNQTIQNRCSVASMPIYSPIMPGSPSNVPISARSVSIGPSIAPIGPPSLSIRPLSASIASTHGVNYYGLQKHNEFPQTSLNQTIQSTRRYMHPASIATKQASYVPAISSMVQSDCKENRHSLPQTSFNTPPQLIKMIASNTQTQGIERWDSSGSHVNLPPFHRTFRAPKSSYQHLGNQSVEAAEPMEAAEFVRQLNVPKEPIRLNPKGKHTNCPLVQFNEKNRAKAVHNLPKMPVKRPNQAVGNRNQIEPTMKVPSNRNFEIDNAMENASTLDSNQPNILSFHVVQIKAAQKIDQRGQNQHNQTTLIGKGPSNGAAIETTCKNMEKWPFLVQNMQDVSKEEQMVLQSTREVTNSEITPIQTATNMCFQSVEANNQKCQGLLYQRDTRRTQDFNRAANEIDNIQDRLQSVKSLRQVRKPSQLEKLNRNGEYLSQLDNPDINQLDNLKDNDDTKDLTNEDQSEGNKLIISIPINRSESTEPFQSSTKHRTTATTTRTNNETQTEEVVILDFDEKLINILEDNTEDISLNQQMDNKTGEGNLAVKNDQQAKHLDNNIEDGSLAADQLRNTLEDGNVPAFNNHQKCNNLKYKDANQTRLVIDETNSSESPQNSPSDSQSSVWNDNVTLAALQDNQAAVEEITKYTQTLPDEFRDLHANRFRINETVKHEILCTTNSTSTNKTNSIKTDSNGKIQGTLRRPQILVSIDKNVYVSLSQYLKTIPSEHNQDGKFAKDICYHIMNKQFVLSHTLQETNNSDQTMSNIEQHIADNQNDLDTTLAAHSHDANPSEDNVKSPVFYVVRQTTERVDLDENNRDEKVIPESPNLSLAEDNIKTVPDETLENLDETYFRPPSQDVTKNNSINLPETLAQQIVDKQSKLKENIETLLRVRSQIVNLAKDNFTGSNVKSLQDTISQKLDKIPPSHHATLVGGMKTLQNTSYENLDKNCISNIIPPSQHTIIAGGMKTLQTTSYQNLDKTCGINTIPSSQHTTLVGGIKTIPHKIHQMRIQNFVRAGRTVSVEEIVREVPSPNEDREEPNPDQHTKDRDTDLSHDRNPRKTTETRHDITRQDTDLRHDRNPRKSTETRHDTRGQDGDLGQDSAMR